MKFFGEYLGVELNDRGEDDKHQIVTLLIEDDGNWNGSNISFSEDYIDDLIMQLKNAKEYIKKKRKGKI